MHDLLISNQIGDTTIKIIENEIKRYVMRVREFKDKADKLQTMGNSEDFDNLNEELRKDEKKLGNIIKKQEKILFVAFHLLLNLAEEL